MILLEVKEKINLIWETVIHYTPYDDIELKEVFGKHAGHVDCIFAYNSMNMVRLHFDYDMQ